MTVTTVLRPDEAGQVVDVAVRVVALDAIAQPEDVADADEIFQALLDLRLVRSGLRFGFSRQELVVSRVPAPLTSMEPPSSTMPGW